MGRTAGFALSVPPHEGVPSSHVGIPGCVLTLTPNRPFPVGQHGLILLGLSEAEGRFQMVSAQGGIQHSSQPHCMLPPAGVWHWVCCPARVLPSLCSITFASRAVWANCFIPHYLCSFALLSSIAEIRTFHNSLYMYVVKDTLLFIRTIDLGSSYPT